MENTEEVAPTPEPVVVAEIPEPAPVVATKPTKSGTIAHTRANQANSHYGVRGASH